jgi:hypothetical protein
MSPLGLIAGVLMSASLDGWSTCARSKWVAVDAERVLYQAADSKEFWVHFRVRNLAAHPVGVQLKAGWQVFYPNQWQGSPTPHRQEINERRLNVSPLTDVETKALLGAWKEKALMFIPAQGDIDYFRVFNGSGNSRKELDVQAGAFMIVAIDGQFRVTDGAAAEEVAPGPDEESRELSLASPVKWSALPLHALRVEPR